MTTISAAAATFSLFSQMETVTTQDEFRHGDGRSNGTGTNPPQMISITDGGQTQIVPINANGQGTATFKFNLFQELSTFSSHSDQRQLSRFPDWGHQQFVGSFTATGTAPATRRGSSSSWPSIRPSSIPGPLAGNPARSALPPDGASAGPPPSETAGSAHPPREAAYSPSFSLPSPCVYSALFVSSLLPIRQFLPGGHHRGVPPCPRRACPPGSAVPIGSTARCTAAGIRPCLELLEDRLAPAALPAPLPTTMLITSLGSAYSFFNQQDSVTVQVASPGMAVNQGEVTFTDGGQKHIVPVSNGTASTTFTFPLASEIPQMHSVGASYSDSTAGFASITALGTLPDTSANYLYQIYFNVLLLQAIGL